MTRLQVDTLAVADFPRWDRYVEEHPSGTIFQTTTWLARVTDGVEVVVASDPGGTIMGGVALGASAKYGVRACHIPPYTPYFGPLVSRSRKSQRSTARTEEQRILDAVIARLPRRLHYDFKLPPGQFDLYPYIRQGFSPQVQYTHEIAGSPEDYRRHMGRRKAFLNKVRQMAGRGEVTLTVGADPLEVITSLRSTARQRGFNPREELLARLVADPVLKPQWTAIVIREPSGELLAGSLLLADHRRLYYLVNTVPPPRRPEWQHVNLLAVDAAILSALESGRVFDFEGSMLPGVEEFYRRLGALAVTTYRLQRSRSFAFFAVRSLRQFLQERAGSRAWSAAAAEDDDEGAIGSHAAASVAQTAVERDVVVRAAGPSAPPT